MAQGRKNGMIPYGDGCPLCPSCFVCPGPPYCVWETGMTKKKQEHRKEIWKPYFDVKLGKVLALGGKG